MIGAMKSGTTTLCRYLSEHPAIYMSPKKEPGHFAHRENSSVEDALDRFWIEPPRRFANPSRYLRLFDGATTEEAKLFVEMARAPMADGGRQDSRTSQIT